jgi:predicted transcriptional regulator
MRYDSVITFRTNEDLKRRITRVLGAKYRTRTVFIRIAVEELLAREERGKPTIPTIQF